MKYLSNVSPFTLQKYRIYDGQEEIVDLESNRQKNVDSESMTKARTRPVISTMRSMEFGSQNRCPNPPTSLKCDDDPERSPSAYLERRLRTVDPKLELVSKFRSSSGSHQITPRTLPAVTATIPDKKDPSARALTENHTIDM